MCLIITIDIFVKLDLFGKTLVLNCEENLRGTRLSVHREPSTPPVLLLSVHIKAIKKKN